MAIARRMHSSERGRAAFDQGYRGRRPGRPARHPRTAVGRSAAEARQAIRRNDGGVSIRIPASHNGLVGLKPTRARTSQGPLIGDALSGLTEELVVAHSVRDVAAILEAVHGPAPGDPYFAPAPLRPFT